MCWEDRCLWLVNACPSLCVLRRQAPVVSNVCVWVSVCVGKTDASIYTLVCVVCTCSWLVMFMSGGGGVKKTDAC